MQEYGHNPERERLLQFQRLRLQTHAAMEAELQERITHNPTPTEMEILAGAFKEMIEPQVRDALRVCYEKGYPTESSGFGGEFGEIQSLDGYFELDQDTEDAIRQLGVDVTRSTDNPELGWDDGYTFISFLPKHPDLQAIKAVWDSIVALLPDRNCTVPPSISGASEDFRKQYAPDRTDVEKLAIQRSLALSEFSPEAEHDMKQRLKALDE